MITPLVSGVVVMIIGLSLIQVGLTSIGGGYAAMSDHTFGAPKNLLLAGVVLAIIILLNRQRNPYLRVASLVIAMAAGYLLAWALGMLPENTTPTNSALITVPTPLYYGLGIDWSLLLPLMLVFMITSLETIGDITATSDVSEQPVSGPLYMKRLKGGVLANGLNSFVSAVFNTFPNSDAGHVRYHRGLWRAYRLPRAAEPPRNHDYCAVSRRRAWRLPAADDFAVCP